jgi:hypothetical protein
LKFRRKTSSTPTWYRRHRLLNRFKDRLIRWVSRFRSYSSSLLPQPGSSLPAQDLGDRLAHLARSREYLDLLEWVALQRDQSLNRFRKATKEDSLRAIQGEVKAIESIYLFLKSHLEEKQND